jgi:hypothetical protein
MDHNHRDWRFGLLRSLIGAQQAIFLFRSLVFEMEVRVSHVVQIETQVRDPAAIAAACQRLNLPAPVFGAAKLFSETKTGWQVRLPGWTYPAVIDVSSGHVDFDNFGGRWGDPVQLSKFLQSYAVEKAKIEARKKGHSVTEQSLPTGEIKLTIRVGGAA